MSNRILDVLICTCGDDGIARVASMQLPECDGVNYVVSWQTHAPSPIVPDVLQQRHDISVVPIDSIGLSRNRNAAFAASQAPICLIADDDLSYTAEALQSIIATFHDNPTIDVATFRHSGGDQKWFPNKEFNLKKPVKGYYVTSFEIALRRHVFEQEGIFFNEEFGIGAPQFTAGEEDLFIHEALTHGMNIRFFPITITTHHGMTTGMRRLSAGVLMAQGAILRATRPLACGLARIPITAIRRWRNGQSGLWFAIFNLCRGFSSYHRF